MAAGTTNIGVAFTNTGTVSVQSGTLEFSSGGSSTASAFTVSSGATLDFGGGTFDLTGGSIGGSGLTEVSGGTLELGSNATTASSFEQAGGTVDGTATLTVLGAATFTGSDVETGSGTTLLQGATSDSGTIYLDGGRTLENAGTFNVTGTAGFVVGGLPSGTPAGGGTIQNNSDGTFDFQTGASIAAGSGADFSSTPAAGADGPHRDDRHRRGVRQHRDGVGAERNAGVQRRGIVGGERDHGGERATLDFGGGTFDLTGGSIGGSGLTEVSGGTLELGSNAVTAGVVRTGGRDGRRNGEADGFGSGDIHGRRRRNRLGDDAPEGATSDSGTIYLDGGRTLENAGTFNVTGTASFVVGGLPSGTPAGGGTIKNDSSATFDFQTGATIAAGSGADSFVNAGTLEQTVATGTTNIGVAFTNTGTVSVQSGTLEFSGGGSSTASAITVASGATLDFGGGTFTLTGGSIGGSGLTEVSGRNAGAHRRGVGDGERDDGGERRDARLRRRDLHLERRVDRRLRPDGGVGRNAGAGIERRDGGVVRTGRRHGRRNGGADGFGGGDVHGDGRRDRLREDGPAKGDERFRDDLSRRWADAGERRHVHRDGDGGLRRRSAFLRVSRPAAGRSRTIPAPRSIFRPGLRSRPEPAWTAFVNAGLLEQTVTTGTTNIGVAFTNTGTVSVKSGTLEFSGGGSSAASAITVAKAATLDFAAGTFTLNGGAYNATGVTEVSTTPQFPAGATLDLSGATSANFGSGLVVAGGNLKLGAVAATAASFEQNGGTIAGTGTLRVNGAATFALSNYDVQTGSGTTLLKGSDIGQRRLYRPRRRARAGKCRHFQRGRRRRFPSRI